MSWLKAAILSCFSECHVVFVLVFTSSFVYLNYNLLVIYQTSKNAPDAWKTNITIDFVKKTVSRLKCGPAEDTFFTYTVLPLDYKVSLSDSINDVGENKHSLHFDEYINKTFLWFYDYEG